MADIKERVTAILAKVADLKQNRDAADVLVSTLGKVKDKLPASAKNAITIFESRKIKKEPN